MSSSHNLAETALGGVVLLTAGIFLAVALSSASFKQTGGYKVTANFAKADGINPGMDVRLSGVKIGSVASLALDPKTYLAKVDLTIGDDIRLPADTVAKVASESLLGGKYLTLEPGADEAMIPPNGRIQFTQAAVNLEDLIGKFIFNGADKSADKNADKADQAAAPPMDATAAPVMAPVTAPAADPYAAAE